RNKGMDLFIESLARLNYQLKIENSPTTVIAFIITKAPIRAINVEVLKSQMMFQDLKHYCQSISEKITERLLRTAALGRSPEIQDLLTQDSMATLKRQHHAWARKGLPAICTHDMQFDGEDAVLKQLRSCYLFNAKEDKVKVIFHPEFLTSTSPLLGLDYDQFVRGAHLGVFPSYYEPWGYTPMECAALGIPSITSDLSGFGSYIKRQMPDHHEKGLYLCRRDQLSFEESADDLTRHIIQFLNMPQKDRIEMRNKVESTSDQFDWNILVNNYWQSHQVALETACRSNTKP
ncbi:MAG: glycosyltransferase, partial [Leptonema sp. (in: Bacteria)]|nr:glycosyltransferase [Leptonema sp. (in: bacteria)]